VSWRASRRLLALYALVVCVALSVSQAFTASPALRLPLSLLFFFTVPGLVLTQLIHLGRDLRTHLALAIPLSLAISTLLSLLVTQVPAIGFGEVTSFFLAACAFGSVVVLGATSSARPRNVR